MTLKAVPGSSVFQFLVIFYICAVDFPSHFYLLSYKASAILTLAAAVIMVLVYLNLIVFLAPQQSPLGSKIDYGFPLSVIIYLFIFLLVIGIANSNFNINTQQNLACYVIIVTSFLLGKRLQSLLDITLVLNKILFASFFSSIVYIATCVKYGAGTSIIYFPRAISMIACLGLAISFCLGNQKIFKRYLFRAVYLAAILLSLSRTAILVSSLTLIALTITNSTRRIVSAIFVSVSMFVVTNFLFSLPIIRNRFEFAGDRAVVGGLKINTAGRAKIWELLLEKGSDSFLLGHGIGASEDLVLNNFPTIAQPHNDFLRVYYDLGIFGLTLLILTLVLLMVSGRTSRDFNSVSSSFFRIRSVLVLQLVILMMTDNPIIYPFYTLPLFFVLGALYNSSKSQSNTG